MRPKNIDSNLYSYHLKQLIKDGYIEQVPDKGYRLSPQGLRYVDYISLETFEPRWQPKLLTQIYVENERDELLMWPKYKQPFIGRWSLPSGKMHYEDTTIELAAMREISYFSRSTPTDLKSRGIVHFRAFIGEEVVSHTIAHLFSMSMNTRDMIHETSVWHRKEDITHLKLSPSTAEIIDLCSSRVDFFFESFEIDY